MAGGEPVQALIRGLDILEAVNRSDRGLSLAEIASATGLKTTTAHNLVRTLILKGYLVKQTKPVRYRTGEALQELVRESCESSLLKRSATVLRSLVQREPKAGVLLSEYLRGEVLVRLQVHPERPGVVQRPHGRTMHPYGSASALLLHAYLPAVEQQAFMERHPFWEHGAHIWKTEDALHTAMAETRKRGVAVPWRRKKRGEFAVAAPVLRPNHELVAILGASQPAEGLKADRRSAFIAAVKEAAAELSAEY